MLIDWAGIRAHAVTIGIRAAARAAAADLPPIEQNRFVVRVLKRAEREGWQNAKLAAQARASQPAQAKPLSSKVITGAQAAANTIAENRSACASLVHAENLRALRASAKRKPLRISNMRDLSEAAKIAEPRSDGAAPGLITLNLIKVELPAIER